VASLGGASERLEGFESCRPLFVNYIRKEIQLSVRSISTPNSTCQDIRITVSDLLELDLEPMCAGTEDPAEPAALPCHVFHTAAEVNGREEETQESLATCLRFSSFTQCNAHPLFEPHSPSEVRSPQRTPTIRPVCIGRS
jgi:hypothetical protein